MKSPLVLRKYLYYLLIFGVILIIVSVIPVNAQQPDSATKVKASKTKKVLYGTASYYSNKFHGRKTANGEIFNQNKFTCACNVLPLGTWIKVTNLKNNKTVVVKVNDRLHPRMKRIIDLTRAAAVKLGYINSGLTRVKIEVLGKKAPQ